MPTTSEPERPIQTLVVGGGLAGLVAAATAARGGGRTVLVDPHELGGRARCDERRGFTFNRGPRALYVGGPASTILTDLGVDTGRGAQPPVRGGMGRRDGRLHLLPVGPTSLLRTSLLGPSDKVRVGAFIARLPRLDPEALAGRSFGEYLHTLGLSPTAADVVRMVARVATYAGDPDAVDAPTVVRQVQLALGAGVRYLDGGFQALVDGLGALAVAAGVEVRRVEVTGVRPAAGGAPPTAITADGAALAADTIVVAVGVPAAAAALVGRPVAGPASLTPPVTAACLELGLRRPPRTRVVFGVGEPLYLSTHCPPAGLAPPGHAVVHVMRNHLEGEDLTPAEQRAWLRAAASTAGVAERDVVEERFLARMVVSGGLPTAAGGGLPGRPAVAATDRPGILLAGDWVGPTGLLADAAVASGAAAGELAAQASGRAGTARSATMAVP